MRFEVGEQEGVLVYKLSGYLKGRPDSYYFLDKVREKLEQQDKMKVVIDLGGVENIDSAGVGVLASIFTAAEESNASLVFSSLSKRVARLIVVVGLMRVLNVVPTLDDAVNSLSGQQVC